MFGSGDDMLATVSCFDVRDDFDIRGEREVWNWRDKNAADVRLNAAIVTRRQLTVGLRGSQHGQCQATSEQNFNFGEPHPLTSRNSIA